MSRFTSITTEQIERFFEGLCTPEEAEAVSEYLQEHPDVLQSYVQRDWKETATGADLPKGYNRKMLTEIKKAQKKDVVQNGKLVAMRRIMVGAAAVIAALVAGIWLLRPVQRFSAPKIGSPVARTHPPIATTARQQWSVIHSTGQDTLHLPDGSTVVLYANSTLRWPEPFEPQRRALSLEGKALFTVAKDEHRPFIVTSGVIETTVLGTEFSVTDSKGDIQVRLYTGRIRLHANDQRGYKDITLEPGQQLDYVKKDTRMLVSRWDEKRDNEKHREEEQYEEERYTGDRPNEELHNGYPVATEPVVEQQLAFDNEPLPQVMDRLAACYHLTLTYNKKQLSNIYFTGAVSTSDSLATILHVIASMNELNIIPGREGYTIRKHIP